MKNGLFIFCKIHGKTWEKTECHGEAWLNICACPVDQRLESNAKHRLPTRMKGQAFVHTDGLGKLRENTTKGSNTG